MGNRDDRNRNGKGGGIADQLKGLGLTPSDPDLKVQCQSLSARLKAFDWFWQYSDQYLESAAREQKKLRAILQEKSCPFTWESLCAWAHDMILEDYEEDMSAPGKFYKKGREREGWAPCGRGELITRMQQEAINTWLANQN